MNTFKSKTHTTLLLALLLAPVATTPPALADSTPYIVAEWTEGLGEYKLTEHHCAIRTVAERFPEICEAETKFLHEVLAAAVEREAHILQGCTACEYKVRFPETGELTDLTWNRESNEESA